MTVCALISLIETDKVKRTPGRLGIISRHIVSLLLSLQSSGNAPAFDVASLRKTLTRVSLECEVRGFQAVFGVHKECHQYLLATSWNVGLQCFQGCCFDEAASILGCCLKLLGLKNGEEHDSLKASCLFLQALALVEREGQTGADEIMRVTMELQKLIEKDSLSELSASLNIPAVIFSCEFAATCANNPKGVTAFVKRCFVAPGMTPEIIESIAHLAKGHDKDGAISLLKHAKQLCLIDPLKHPALLGRLFRNLLSLIESSDGKRKVYEEFVALAEASKSIFAPEDIRWCCLRAWNIGVQYFRTDQPKLAEQWMGLALKLASMLNSEPYEATMLEGYREVLRSAA